MRQYLAEHLALLGAYSRTYTASLLSGFYSLVLECMHGVHTFVHIALVVTIWVFWIIDMLLGTFLAVRQSRRVRKGQALAEADPKPWSGDTMHKGLAKFLLYTLIAATCEGAKWAVVFPFSTLILSVPELQIALSEWGSCIRNLGLVFAHRRTINMGTSIEDSAENIGFRRDASGVFTATLPTGEIIRAPQLGPLPPKPDEPTDSQH